jgi:hypothetical protein
MLIVRTNMWSQSRAVFGDHVLIQITGSNKNKVKILICRINDSGFKVLCLSIENVDTKENLNITITRGLNGLVSLSIENDMLENIDVDVIINHFASQNV